MDDAKKHLLYAKIALTLGFERTALKQMMKAERILVDRILRKQYLGNGIWSSGGEKQ